MRRLIIAAFMALGALGLAAGVASAQYVTPPGETPSVGSAGFGGDSAEVRGESVERPAGSAGIAGSPAAGSEGASETGDAAEVAGVETSRVDELAPVEDRELSARTSRSTGEGRGIGSLLAFTGIALVILTLAGAALIWGGKVLHNFRSPQES